MNQHMLPPIARAKLTAEALAASIKITPERAHELIAQTLGFETWSQFSFKATQNPSDKMDVELSHDIAHNRLNVFSDRLSQVLQTEPYHVEQLAQSINPYAKTPPKAYRLDLAQSDKDVLNIHELLEAAGGEDGMLEFIHSLADNHPELSRLKEFDTFRQLQDTFRLSAPIEPSLFYDAILNLTDWEIEESSFEYEYEYLSPSFYLVSSFDHAEYPVYLLSLVATPGDSLDETFERIKSEIGKHSSRALILFRTGVFKEIQGITYFVIGTFFDSMSWTWTLLTEEDPETQSKTICPKNYDLESPSLGKEFEVGSTQGVPKSVVYHAFVTGQIDHDEDSVSLNLEHMRIHGVGGWSQLI